MRTDSRLVPGNGRVKPWKRWRWCKLLWELTGLPKRSFRARLTLSVGLLVACGMLLFAVVYGWRLNQVSDALTETRTRTLFPLIRSALAAPLIERDLTTLREIVTEAVESADIASLSVYDPEGHLLAHAQSSEVAPNQDGDLWRRELSFAGERIGRVDMRLSTATVDLARTDLLVTLGLTGLAVLALVWIALGGLALRLTRDLEFLCGTAGQLANGDFATRAPVRSDDEVGTLARTLNGLASAIESQLGNLSRAESEQRSLAQDLRQSNAHLLFLAERDPLTGLYNRRRFDTLLAERIAEARRSNMMLAVLMIDLDDFKEVNDSLGHQAGDLVLVRLSGELNTHVRANETLARLGGDEFAIVARIDTPDEAEQLAARIVRAVAHMPVQLDARRFALTTSIGIALYPSQVDSASDLLAAADAAMYQAKQAGKNSWRVFRDDPAQRARGLARLSWNERLAQALDCDLFELHYQGVWRADGTLGHVEALLRLRIDSCVDGAGEAPPQTGVPTRYAMPSDFIPHAEKSGSILAIDRWVLRQAIADLAVAPAELSAAVNLSGRSFGDATLATFIDDTLRAHRVESARLIIEITETAAVSDLYDAQCFISTLRALGCRIALDDFGAGYSSFSYLKFLNADFVKIDGQFVRDLPRQKDDRVIVEGMARVARGLGKTVIAEFVEDAETAAILRELGIDLMQGFYFDKPQASHPALGCGYHAPSRAASVRHAER